jgi:copper homeostasis protein
LSNQQSELINRKFLILLEVIVQTIDDAVAAAAGGADRLEVVRAIRDGGLTPPLSLVQAIARVTTLPLRVMVRDNAGFETTPAELRDLRRAARAFAAAGADGIVIGFAREGELLRRELADVLDAAPGLRATFHRAFDTLRDPDRAIEVLATVPAVDRILTSGGDGTAAERCVRLRDYSRVAGSRLTIIAGGGVDEEAFAMFAQEACVRELHVGRAAREGNDPEGPVTAARVRRLRSLADGEGYQVPGSGHES